MELARQPFRIRRSSGDDGAFDRAIANGCGLEGNSFYTSLFATPLINERACAYASRVWVEHAKAGVAKYFVYQMFQSDGIMHPGPLRG